MFRKKQNVFRGKDWTISDLQGILEVCEDIAKKEFHLNLYQNRLEIVSYEQMLDAYTSNGLPIMYNHWSFGKKFLREERYYKAGNPLAYELVINSNPCINYLLENNNKTVQILVIAHAACGHNHFFKNNYMFRTFTDASFILDYLKFANEYVRKCEERYGENAVEKTLDSAHALFFMGIDKYVKKPKSMQNEQQELKEKTEWLIRHYDDIMERTTSLTKRTNSVTNDEEESANTFEQHDDENILYFLEKNSPILKTWQREILRIVRNLAQYFYPQITTKVFNEGFATFIHYHIMERLWEEKYIDDGQYMEFLSYHTAVLRQLSYKEDGVVMWNPYYLGFSILMDIKKMCENPDDEDLAFKPELKGKDWKKVILDVVENYRDDSLILEFLSPKLIKKMQIFTIYDDEDKDHYMVSSIHNELGYDRIRRALSEQYNPVNIFPDVVVRGFDKKTRILHLDYHVYKKMDLNSISVKALQHLQKLWGYEVIMDFIDDNKTVDRIKVGP